MWVAPSPLFSRRKGPHIKNFRVGSELGNGGCVSLCLCAFSALDVHARARAEVYVDGGQVKPIKTKPASQPHFPEI